jgi:predicted transcriptional regulator
MREMNRPPLSDAEREVLRVLWDHGPGTVREVTPCSKSRAAAGPTRP